MLGYSFFAKQNHSHKSNTPFTLQKIELFFLQLKIKQLKNVSLGFVSNQFKIFLLVTLSFLSIFDLSANDTFFSIEKSSNRVYKLAEAGVKFTTKQIDDYVLFATKQGDQSKVMLGLYDNGGASSYISKAGNSHTYFDMGTAKWTEAENIVGGSLDEMWKINKKFIDEQKALGKEFWFSHDPFSPIEGQFYAREINYLIDEGVTDFVKIGDSWKAVW
jgi:hypothetical protein